MDNFCNKRYNGKGNTKLFKLLNIKKVVSFYLFDGKTILKAVLALQAQ